MSDALSDGARAGCLDDAYQNYFVALVEYLKSGSDPIKVVAVVTAAREVDENQRGRGTLAENTPQILAELQDNNRTTWARTLMTAMESRGRLFSQAQFKELRALSPFKNGFMVVVDDFGNSGCQVGGEISTYLSRLVRPLREGNDNYRERFLVLFPDPGLDENCVIPLNRKKK